MLGFCEVWTGSETRETGRPAWRDSPLQQVLPSVRQSASPTRSLDDLGNEGRALQTRGPTGELAVFRAVSIDREYRTSKNSPGVEGAIAFVDMLRKLGGRQSVQRHGLMSVPPRRAEDTPAYLVACRAVEPCGDACNSEVQESVREKDSGHGSWRSRDKKRCGLRRRLARLALRPPRPPQRRARCSSS